MAATTPHQRQPHFHQPQSTLHPTPSSAATSPSSRRVLPMPNKVEPESAARNVRLLLEQNHGHHQPLPPPPAGEDVKRGQQQRHLLTNGSAAGTRVVGGGGGGGGAGGGQEQERATHAHYHLIPEEEEEDEEVARMSDQFASAALPGDSFPDTGERLLDADGETGDASSPGEDVGAGAADEALLRRLRQSQARMEQIKRMLVTQRGYIVRSLRQVAEGRGAMMAAAAAAAAAAATSRAGADERDRTLGSTYRLAAHQLEAKGDATAEHQQEDAASSASTLCDASDDAVAAAAATGGRLCPMCEAAFPAEVDEEAFESHVVEHFCFEDAETLKYLGEQELDDGQQPPRDDQTGD